MGLKSEFYASDNMLVVKADLPVDAKTASGIHLPAQRHDPRFGKNESGCVKGFADGEFQVVSGTVLASPARAWTWANLPTAMADGMGIPNTPYQNGLSECRIFYEPPKAGDRVWFGYGTWGAIESEGMAGFEGDDMVGKMSCHSVYLCQTGGEFRPVGLNILCEPIPEEVPTGLDVGKMLGHRKNQRIARFIGKAVHVPNCTNLKHGDTIWHAGVDKLGIPVPKELSPSGREWSLVRPQDVAYINPGFIKLPTDMDAAWDAVDAHNRAIARAMSKNAVEPTEYHELEVDQNEVDYLAELHKEHIRAYKKIYRSKWF